jgi:secondary thiamine-phosphate synthase enzyme
MRQVTVRTERRTQLVDITRRIQDALDGVENASAVLVYVPHTTAGITINEGADPAVARDLEAAAQRVVEDGWEWEHVEDADGPNAPSHVRASLVGPQVLVPLDAGRLALGTWQAIFFCEFDGPRERKVLLTPLA